MRAIFFFFWKIGRKTPPWNTSFRLQSLWHGHDVGAEFSFDPWHRDWLFLQREKLCRDVKYHINVEVVNMLPQTSVFQNAFQPNQGHVRNLHIVQGGFFFPFSDHAWSSSSPNSDFCVHPDLYPITGSRRPSATFSSLDEKRRRVSRVCYRTRFRIGSFRAYTCVRKRCVDSVLQLLLLYQAGWTPQLDKFFKFYQV